MAGHLGLCWDVSRVCRIRLLLRLHTRSIVLVVDQVDGRRYHRLDVP
jgi:hypothetical protein